MAREVAYLDTSILANWLIYYRKPKRWLQFRERDKARQSMELLQGIKSKRYETQFLSSDWSIAELSQSALDYKIAIRMIRDGRNPRFFQTIKQQYPLTNEEKSEIFRSLTDFLLSLDKLGVEMFTPEVDYTDVADFSFNYGVESTDAIHLSIARKMKSKYFLTIDEKLKNAEIKELEVMYPSTFDYSQRQRLHKKSSVGETTR